MLKLKMILVMFLWATCFPLIGLGLPNAPHITFAALRALLAGTTLLTLSLATQKAQPRGVRQWLMLTIIGLGATTLGFFGMFHASEFVAPGMATVIANTQPIMAAGLAALYLNERLSRRGQLGLLLGFFGVVLITLPTLMTHQGSFHLGIGYILLAALGITLSNVAIRALRNRIDALTAMGWQLLIGGGALAVLALLTEQVTTIQWTPSFIISLIGLALPGTALAYWLWCHILAQIELNQANAYSFLVPLFGLLMGVIFFHEKLTFITIPGILLTLIGIVLVNWKPPLALAASSVTLTVDDDSASSRHAQGTQPPVKE